LQNNPLDRARLDLTTLFVVNSAMWMKMCTRGETPSQNDELKNELVSCAPVNVSILATTLQRFTEKNQRTNGSHENDRRQEACAARESESGWSLCEKCTVGC
jgi:hypothetical protein